MTPAQCEMGKSFLGLATRQAESYFPNQGSVPHALQGKLRVLTMGLELHTIPTPCFIKAFASLSYLLNLYLHLRALGTAVLVDSSIREGK